MPMKIKSWEELTISDNFLFQKVMLDLSALSKGEDYVSLKKSYVIFICTFDPFGFDRKLYSFRNACREENIDLSDGSEKLFLNTEGKKGEVDEDIDNFLKYIDKNLVVGDFIKNIADVVAKIKEHKELGVEYMSMLAEFHDLRRLALAEGRVEGRVEGRAEGRAEGRVENIISNARSLMEKTGWTLAETLKMLNVSTEDSAVVLKRI